MRFREEHRGTKKYLGRYDKDFINSIESKIVRTDKIGVAGYASNIKILEVNRPFTVGEKGSEIYIADIGYSLSGLLGYADLDDIRRFLT